MNYCYRRGVQKSVLCWEVVRGCPFLRGFTVILTTVLCVAESVRGLEGEGMCHPKRNDLRGNLYFIFEVDFPENGFMNEKDLKASVSSASHSK